MVSMINIVLILSVWLNSLLLPLLYYYSTKKVVLHTLHE